MILSLPGQNLSTLVANATEEVEEEEHLASSGSAGKYPEARLAILNSNTSTPCLNAPIQSVSSSEDDDNGDEDEDDNDAMKVLDGDFETEWSAGRFRILFAVRSWRCKETLFSWRELG